MTKLRDKRLESGWPSTSLYLPSASTRFTHLSAIVLSVLCNLAPGRTVRHHIGMMS